MVHYKWSINNILFIYFSLLLSFYKYFLLKFCIFNIFFYICNEIQENIVMNIDKELERDIRSYCNLNGIKFTKYVNDLLKKQFMIEKYGNVPFGKIEETDSDKAVSKVESIKPVPIETEEKKDTDVQTDSVIQNDKKEAEIKTVRKIKIIKK